MTAALWSYAALFAWATLVTVASVGQPRKPITGRLAAWSVAINSGLVLVLVLAALR